MEITESAEKTKTNRIVSYSLLAARKETKSIHNYCEACFNDISDRLHNM